MMRFEGHVACLFGDAVMGLNSRDLDCIRLCPRVCACERQFVEYALLSLDLF